MCSIYDRIISDPQELYEFCSSQAITAMAWDVVINYIQEGKIGDEMIPIKLKLRWALSAEQIKKQYYKKKSAAVEFVDAVAERGIKTYCFKGLALSTYYPKPYLRECGDFDCWMGGDFDAGNSIAKEIASHFDSCDYRHSHIDYKGLTIENHKYFLQVRGDGRNKRLERYLRTIAPSDRRIDGTNIFYPSVQFHATFIPLHMLHHLLFEHLTLRHVLDWYYFVQKECDNVDWKEFNQKCGDVGATGFVEALNCICVEKLGLDVQNTDLRISRKYADRLWSDIITSNCMRASAINGIWHQRYIKLQNILQNSWKFGGIYDRSVLSFLVHRLKGIMFEKNVKI